MITFRGILAAVISGVAVAMQAQQPAVQVQKPGYRVFQFPRTAIPRIDGDFSDWDIVPDTYAVGIDEMWDDTG